MKYRFNFIELAVIALGLPLLLVVQTGCEVEAEDAPTANCGDTTFDSSDDTDQDGISDITEDNNADEGYHLFGNGQCDADPSFASGSWCGGSLQGGINLKDSGPGYRHSPGCDGTDNDDWGTLKLLQCIELSGIDWTDYEPFIYVGDLSLQSGGDWPDGYNAAGCEGHDCHENGLEVDIRYVRECCDYSQGFDIVTSPGLYDAAATQLLMQKIIDNCDVELIYCETGSLGFSNADLGVTNVLQQLAGHTNHFHVRLAL